MADEAEIIKLLSEAAQAEAERLEIERERLKLEVERRKEEAEKLSVMYEILSIGHQRKEIEKEYVEVIRLLLAVLNEVAEEVIGQARETRETIALLLHVVLNGKDKDDTVRDNLKTLVYQPDSKLEEVQRLIGYHQEVLARYREQAAKFGMHTPPFIDMEIENNERKITELQEKLREM